MFDMIQLSPSVSSFSTVADGENRDFLFVVLIERDVGGLAELDNQFSASSSCFVDGSS